MDWTQQVAAGSIYIDFEGEGQRGGNIPEPHLLGAYCPSKELGDNGYKVFFHRENWKSAANGCYGYGEVLPLQQALEHLITEVEASGTKLAYWSDHERGVVGRCCENLLVRIEQNSVNILSLARKFCNRNGVELPSPTRDRKTLNDYLKALEIDIDPVQPPGPGPAELCRQIDRYRGLRRRWRSWTEDKKTRLRGLVAYNREDCIATSEIAMKVAG